MLALLGSSQAGTTTMTRTFGKILVTERQVNQAYGSFFELDRMTIGFAAFARNLTKGPPTASSCARRARPPGG